MATSYPSGIDSFVDPVGTDLLGAEDEYLKHHRQHSDVNDAVSAIETELGTNPRGSFTSVGGRIGDLDARLTAITGISGITDGLQVATVTDAAGTERSLVLATTVSSLPKNRWTVTATSTAESGSSAGSDLEVRAYGDAGSVRTGTGVIAGSTGAVLRIIRSDGSVTVGGSVEIKSTTASSTPSTGSLVLGGGAGIAGNVNVGGALTVATTASITGNLSVNAAATTTLSSRVDAGAVTYATVPVGMLAPFAGTTAPSGWLICNGASYAQSSYPALASVLGVSSGTFTVPDMRSRVAAGYLSGDSNFGTLRGTGGSATKTLTTDNLPSHQHSTAVNHSHTAHSTTTGSAHEHSAQFSVLEATAGQYPTASGDAVPNAGRYDYGRFTATIRGSGLADGGLHTHAVTVDTNTASYLSDFRGNGNPVNILPPYMSLNWIIKY
jgi:microcystin-dependent protein